MKNLNWDKSNTPATVSNCSSADPALGISIQFGSMKDMGFTIANGFPTPNEVVFFGDTFLTFSIKIHEEGTSVRTYKSTVVFSGYNSQYDGKYQYPSIAAEGFEFIIPYIDSTYSVEAKNKRMATIAVSILFNVKNDPKSTEVIQAIANIPFTDAMQVAHVSGNHFAYWVGTTLPIPYVIFPDLPSDFQFPNVILRNIYYDDNGFSRCIAFTLDWGDDPSDVTFNTYGILVTIKYNDEEVASMRISEDDYFSLKERELCFMIPTNSKPWANLNKDRPTVGIQLNQKGKDPITIETTIPEFSYGKGSNWWPRH